MEKHFLGEIQKKYADSGTVQEVFSFLSILEQHSRVTYHHCVNVGYYCSLLCTHLGLSSSEAAEIVAAGLVHDLGKLKVPADILDKPEALASDEWELMKKHPGYAGGYLTRKNIPETVHRDIRYHHERWDGEGYEGLNGEEVPFGSRVIAVADAFDAMTSDRAYHYPKSVPESMAELERCKGSQFDPNVVEAFTTLIKTYESTATAFGSPTL